MKGGGGGGGGGNREDEETDRETSYGVNAFRRVRKGKG